MKVATVWIDVEEAGHVSDEDMERICVILEDLAETFERLAKAALKDFNVTVHPGS